MKRRQYTLAKMEGSVVTLFAIVFYGTWGTPSARNEMIAIPVIAEGYQGRAKSRAGGKT
jgi:hypothetical protein